MNSIVFIGDELTATGFRLAGIETFVPGEHVMAAAILAQARKTAGLVIITAATARTIPADELDAALSAESPIVAVVPDVLLRTHPPDVAKRLRAMLGIES